MEYFIISIEGKVLKSIQVLETLVESGFSRTCLETDDIFSITNSVGGFVSPAKEFSELGNQYPFVFLTVSCEYFN